MAAADSIKVRIKRYKDRRNLVLCYADPVSLKLVTRSAGTHRIREAERAARDWERELAAGIATTRDMTWEAFRLRYEAEHLAAKAEKTAIAAATAFNHLERVLQPARLSTLTSDTVSRFQAMLRATKMSDSTIAAHLRCLRAALNWAHRKQLIPQKVLFDMPRVGKMRKRPITGEEFERLLAVVPEVRRHDAAAWTYYLHGLWLSGLRLGESLVLSWDQHDAFAVDLDGRRPKFRIRAEAQKRRKDQTLPMTPDFAAILLETPDDQRQGSVFRLVNGTGKTLAKNTVGRVIAAMGAKANIVADPCKRTFASAHDLRRSFGTRWAQRVKPHVLKDLMRHSNIATTLEYYVDQDADDIAEDLWSRFGNSFGNIAPESPATSEAPVAKTTAITSK